MVQVSIAPTKPFEGVMLYLKRQKIDSFSDFPTHFWQKLGTF